ncbi:hypothetical protein [Fischerella sp. JS2]|uniref:hypothetical protein n=1 Tax=Fischerella sp. JS2 TaxID=2597771 RepID=UPI0028E24428|nr:hypothetical protein [Fischerella sp. JS2]
MTRGFIIFKDKLSYIQNQAETLERCLNQPDNKDTEKAAILEVININKALSQRKNDLEKRLNELELIQHKLKECSAILQKIRNKIEERQESNFNKDIILNWINYNFLVKEIAENNQHPIKHKEENTKTWKPFIDAHISLYMFIKQAEGGYSKPEDEEVQYIIEEALKYALKALIDTGLRLNFLPNEAIENLNLEEITPKEPKTVLIFLLSVKKWDLVYKKLAES